MSSDLLNLVALAVAVLALVVAVLSAKFTRDQRNIMRLDSEERARPALSLLLAEGDGYTLTNRGGSPAFDVNVDPPPRTWPTGELTRPVLHPSEGMTFGITRSLVGRADEVVVTWTDGSAPERVSRKMALPPRPGA